MRIPTLALDDRGAYDGHHMSAAPRRRPGPSRKEATHNRIVETAARAIRRSGYGGTGLAEIMKEAGLTHGGFYAHFNSREGMLAEAADRAGAESLAVLARAAAAASSVAGEASAMPASSAVAGGGGAGAGVGVGTGAGGCGTGGSGLRVAQAANMSVAASASARRAPLTLPRRFRPAASWDRTS